MFLVRSCVRSDHALCGNDASNFWIERSQVQGGVEAALEGRGIYLQYWIRISVDV